jgi:proline dehydrogenase
VDRFVAGTTGEDAIDAVDDLVAAGLTATVDHLGEDTVSPAQADATRDAYVELLARLSAHGLAARAEVSLKLSAVGQALPVDGARVAGPPSQSRATSTSTLRPGPTGGGPQARCRALPV